MASHSKHFPFLLLSVLATAIVGKLFVSKKNIEFDELLIRNAISLPRYAAREGRTCDNCHTDPTDWKNPELSQRKCNLSCLTCHVNPSGGGLRNVVGRFYSQATLPAMFASHRGYKDSERHLISHLESLDEPRRNRLPDPAFGNPVGGSSLMAYDRHRYAGLNANPLLQLGIDLRLAGWFAAGAPLFFPMQLDTYAALHPISHLTLYANGGVLGKAKGFGPTLRQEVPFMIKDLFLMLHELPYMMYLRVGRFIPYFGTFVDDHTSPIRRDFELDHGQVNSRVTGLEIGLAPNYPYLHVAVSLPSRSDAPSPVDPEHEQLTPFFGVSGWSFAASGGWRDLGWQVGTSVMVRERRLIDGGNTQAVSLQWSFNPWYWLDALPITYMGEIAFGQKQRPYDGSYATHLALFHEIDYLAFNGINLSIKYDLSDPDRDVMQDHSHRFTLGTELFVLPNVSLSAYVRMRKGAIGEMASDGFFMLHSWY